MVKEFEPKIIGFLCKWCNYDGADLASTKRIEYPPNVTSIHGMCSGRIDTVFILEAFKKGADGIFIAGCHQGDCHYQSGNYKTNRRIKLLKKFLKEMGIEQERIRFEYVSASEDQKFTAGVTDFINELKKLGPSPLKN